MSREHTHRTLDRAGMIVSVLCAIHCAITPILLGLLPLSGFVGILASSKYEGTFLTAAVVLGIGSLAWGFRIHRLVAPSLLLVAGIVLIFVGHRVLGHGHRLEVFVVVAGALAMAAAHGVNLHHCMRCNALEHAHPEGEDHAHTH